jgi:antibiotic biosynthesis monooxygenase (ABM) superfamily enzyme
VSSRGTDVAAETTAGRAPATVVIEQRVKPGREEDFREWQERMNRAVAAFAGFLGTEVVPPSAGDREWTILYRFDSRPRLDRWLASSERSEMLDEGDEIFDGPATQQVLIGERREPVTVVVSHPVDPARVEEFREWQQRVTDAESDFPGFSGSELFRPVPGVQEEWTAVFSFDTEEHLDAWLESPERRRLLDEGSQFHDFGLHRISSPFGSWFSTGAEDPGSPAQWKTALSVLVGLYPTAFLLGLGIAEIWESGELWQRLLLSSILSVSLLTWVVMPVVTRALGFWLLPPEGQSSRRRDLTGIAVSVAFLTLAAAAFWLVTTQLWTLP